jgi:hypothetical protein
MAGVGINVASMFVSAVAGLGPGRVGRAVEDILAQRGIPLVDRQPLEARRWDEDRALFGIAVSPAIDGWILVADTEGKPSHDLAEQLAGRLSCPVVISSLYEICDPPEPQHNVVYGDACVGDDQFPNFYELAAHRYQDLAHPQETYQFFPSPPFDPREVVFLTFRADTVPEHYRHWQVCPVVPGADVPF